MSDAVRKPESDTIPECGRSGKGARDKSDWGWWESLPEQVEKVRVEMNGRHNAAVAKWLRILALTVLLFGLSALLSLLQPMYIADKIGTSFFGTVVFEVGIILGHVMSERIQEETFKKLARAEK